MPNANETIYSKIVLNEKEGYAYIETPTGRFIINPGLDFNHSCVFVSFQPRPYEEGVFPLEQQLVCIQEIQEDIKIRPKMRVVVWKKGYNKDYTYIKPDIKISTEVWKTAEGNLKERLMYVYD